jgi:hypothetical protein
VSYLDQAKRIAEAELAKVPVDWPARFRAAAEVAERMSPFGISDTLDGLADALDSGAFSPDVVEAIGRALLGKQAAR